MQLHFLVPHLSLLRVSVMSISCPIYVIDGLILVVFNAANWPKQDVTPDVNSEEVQEWMKELDGYNIPDLSVTPDGTCVNDTSAATDAAARGWWTCGGYTRPTDIVACPDKLTWGVR